jgi:hypothetical protein
MRCDPLPSNYPETAFFAEERGIVSAGAGFLDFQMEVFFQCAQNSPRTVA